MKLETRTGKDATTGRIFIRNIVLIVENEGESRLLDEAFGENVTADGTVAYVFGSVRVSDGYGEHYIELKKGLPG